MSAFDFNSIRKGMKYSIIEGSFASVFIALSTGAFLTGYALVLGANEFVIGVIGAIPFISQAMQFLGAYLLKKYKSPKKLAIAASIFNRWIWFVLIFLPFIDVNSKVKILIFLVVLFISSSAGTVLANIWTTWISEIVPRRVWGKYFGVRSAYNNAVNVVIFLITAGVIDWLKRVDIRMGYLVSSSICFLSGVVTTFLFKYHPDIKFDFVQMGSFKDEVLKPFKDENFKRFVKFFALWNFSIGLSAPFMAYHMIVNLRISFTTIAIFNMLTMTLNILFSHWWGRLIDRFGARSVLMFNASNIVYIPFFWLIATPNFHIPLYLDAIVTGIAWSGFNLAAFSIQMSMSPKESRSSYVAVVSILSGFGYLTASTLGGYIATLFKDFSLNLFGLKFINLHILFALSFFARLLSAINLASIPEGKEGAFFAMVDSISATILRVFSGIGAIIASNRKDETS